MGRRMAATLYYAHDPMCSWCWAFRPAWERITSALPEKIEVRRILGGLAPDSQEPMSPDMQLFLQQTWRNIERRVPGTRFEYRFWQDCTPRRSTYPACRAVIAAKCQAPGFEEPMIHAIQRAYYLQARNPSDAGVLVQLAGEIGLDTERFAFDSGTAQTHDRLMEEIAFGRAIGVQGFPSLVLQGRDGYRPLSYDYNDPEVVLAQLG
jgi:putative protein-disulfide isomerase